MRKISISAIVAISLLSTCTNLSAEGLGVNFQLTGTSNYMLRGLTQSNDKAAVFGDITVSYDNFFAGVWASNVDFENLGVSDADIEIDYYAGYANSFKDFSLVALYAKYTYPGSDYIDDLDELKFNLSYAFDKITIGTKYEIGIWNESHSDKLDYIEGYTSYDFGLANLNLSAGSYEDIGDNYMIGLSKEGIFAGQDVKFNVNYVNFEADNKGYPFDDDDTIYAEVIFSF